MPLPENVNLDVCFESLDVSAQYFDKLTLSVDKNPLETFGAQIRSTAMEHGDMTAAISWAKEERARLVSLMYADIEISAGKHQELLQVVKEAVIRIGKERLLASEKSA